MKESLIEYETENKSKEELQLILNEKKNVLEYFVINKINPQMRSILRSEIKFINKTENKNI